MKRVMIHVDLSLVITVELVTQPVNATINLNADIAMRDGSGNNAMNGNQTPAMIIIVLTVHSAFLRASPTNAFVMTERRVCFLMIFFLKGLTYHEYGGS